MCRSSRRRYLQHYNVVNGKQLGAATGDTQRKTVSCLIILTSTMVMGTRRNPRDDQELLDTPDTLTAQESLSGSLAQSRAADDIAEETTLMKPRSGEVTNEVERKTDPLDTVTSALERIETILSTMVNSVACAHEQGTPQRAAADVAESDGSEKLRSRQGLHTGYEKKEEPQEDQELQGEYPISLREREICSPIVKKISSQSGDCEVYPAHVAFKIYQKGMQTSHCKRIGDSSFFVAKRTWDKLTIDFPTTAVGQKRLLPLAFEGDARLVYEDLASSNPSATCTHLWNLLQTRLCNEVHQSSLRDRFMAMKWNERKETFDRFAWRLQSAPLLLPDRVDDGLLLNRLRTGLPTRLQDQAKLVFGTFDEVVSRISILSSTQPGRMEAVREIRESKHSVNRFANV